MRYAARTRLAWLLAAASIGAGEAEAQLGEHDTDPALATYPIVITPTRLRQSLADVPASVTVITAEMIREFGILSIPEALRLVPGMAITQASGNDIRMNYHGTNILVPRRMNVLIDGLSVYRPAFARVDWKELPVAIEDVERIEVTRSPNSAAYGPNSMLAVVNIITKHPDDVERAMVSATVGSLDTRNVTARLATKIGDTSAYVTFNHEQDSGYDAIARNDLPPHDSTRLNRVNFRSHTALSAASSLDFQAAFVDGTKEVPFLDPFQVTFPDQSFRDYYVGGLWSTAFSPTHQLQLRANYSNHDVSWSWRSCPPTALMLPELFALWRANPAYASAIVAGQRPAGGSATDNALAAATLAAVRRLGPRALQPTCATANQDFVESRADLELQDTYVFSDQLRLVAGLGAREDRGKSQTFLGGTVSNTSFRAFANVEYKPSRWLSLNAGGYAERDELSGSTFFSPRIGANVHFSPNQTVRAVLSTGTRSPDIQEQRVNWTFSSNDLNPPLNGSTSGRFYQSAIAPGGLDSERITSWELGYLLRLRSLGLLLDARVFNDELKDLISEKLQLSDFHPTNNNSVRLSGAELEVNFMPSEQWTLFLNYAYLRNRQATTELERTQYSAHSGAVGVSQAFGDGWRWSLAYYGASGDGVGENYFGREDLTLAKTFKLQAAQATVSLIARRLDNRSVTYFRDFGDTLRSEYDNRWQIYGYFKIGL